MKSPRRRAKATKRRAPARKVVRKPRARGVAVAPVSAPFKVPSEYDRPELMAIGDSLYNGVRSLTINRQLARLSPPARVAEGFGFADFINPNYPYEVLIDVEDFLRGNLDIGALPKLKDLLLDRILINAEDWERRRDRWSNKLFFDNISISGAEIATLYTDQAGPHRDTASGLTKKLREHRDQFSFGDIATLYYTLNAAFLLNPSAHPELMDKTSLDLVALRKPRRLLVNIGSNEGIFMGCMLARLDDDIIRSVEAIPEKMEQLAAEMRRRFAPDCAPLIVFNNLVRPSAVANLTQRNFASQNQGCNTYYDLYYGNLMNTSNIRGTQVAEFDRLIAKVNAEAARKVKAVFAGDTRHQLLFADINSLSKSHDDKHGCERKTDRITVRLNGREGVHLTNFPLWSFVASGGGLFSLDNMHLTSVGYAMMANEVGRTVAAAAPGRTFTPIPYQRACDEDSLLQQPPRNWPFIKFMVQLIGGLALTFLVKD